MSNANHPTVESDSADGGSILFPLSETVTARSSLDHALDVADGGTIHIVVLISGVENTPDGDQERAQAESMLRRAETWAHETDPAGNVSIQTAMIGQESYLYGPRDIVWALESYAETHGIEQVLIDPEYHVGEIGPMTTSFDSKLKESFLEVHVAPVSRPAEHQDPVSRFSPVRVGTLFGISLAFYLVLGDPLYWFDWTTGIVVAAVVALTLNSVTFANAPEYPGSIVRTIRFAFYVPYLVGEIIKANVAISIVILRPSLPIDPKMTAVDVRVGNGLPLLALANSITLTPGTLTVRANDQRLLIHTLIPSAREDLFGGRLERAIRFVFYGREHAAIASPEERGDAKVYQTGETE